jgi:hypothetical protein
MPHEITITTHWRGHDLTATFHLAGDECRRVDLHQIDYRKPAGLRKRIVQLRLREEYDAGGDVWGAVVDSALAAGCLRRVGRVGG